MVCRDKAVLLGILLWAVAPHPASAGQRTISIGDCNFAAHPDNFLAREARIRANISAATVRVSAALPRSAAAAPRDAASIPHRNFIDDLIFGAMAAQHVPSARLTTDEEFFRRINLDLIGKIPAPDDVRSFVADSSADKRDRVIDSLLYSPEFVDRWTMWMGDLLQNTASSSNVSRQIGGRDAFFNWIRLKINDGTSLRDIAWETVATAGNSFDPNAGATNFAVGMSTPMGPIQDTYDTFLWRSTQTYLGMVYYDCLLCHNGRGHLDGISLWGSQTSRMQAEQMAAFFSRVRMPRNPAPNGAPLYLSSDVGDAAIGSYDLNTTYGNRPNRVAIGNTKTLTPVYRDGSTPPDSSSFWRDAFASFLTSDPMFARNFANRIWKHFFNLGLVDPVDTMDPARLDPANPPPAPWTLQAANPALLERLASTLVERNYSLREFIRVVVQSNAYQLSSRYDGDWNVNNVPLYARHYPRRLDAEEIADAIVKATGVPGGYTAPGWSDIVLPWAMQLPDTVSGGPAAAFMNTFLRGNRDTQQRRQDGSILQQLTMMNDPFVLSRNKVAASPALKAVSQMSDDNAAVEQMFLTFLSRVPTDQERQIATASLGQANTAALRNTAIEDLAWVLMNKLDFLFSY